MRKKVFLSLTYSIVELCALTLQSCLLRDSTHTATPGLNSRGLAAAAVLGNQTRKSPFMYNIQGNDQYALLSAGYFLTQGMSRETTF